MAQRAFEVTYGSRHLQFRVAHILVREGTWPRSITHVEHLHISTLAMRTQRNNPAHSFPLSAGLCFIPMPRLVVQATALHLSIVCRLGCNHNPRCYRAARYFLQPRQSPLARPKRRDLSPARHRFTPFPYYRVSQSSLDQHHSNDLRGGHVQGRGVFAMRDVPRPLDQAVREIRLV